MDTRRVVKAIIEKLIKAAMEKYHISDGEFQEYLKADQTKYDNWPWWY